MSGEVLGDDVDIVFELGTDGNNRCGFSNGALDEVLDILELVGGVALLDEVDLILENDDVLHLHDLDGGEVLGGLRLGTGLVASDEEEGAVHDSGAVEHCGHEDVVAWAINEADVAHERHGAVLETRGGARRRVMHGGGVGGKAVGTGYVRVLAHVQLGVGIPKLDGDVALQLILETHGLHPAQSLHNCGLPVRHVAYRADVDRRLPADHLRRQRRQLAFVQLFKLLISQPILVHLRLFSAPLRLRHLLLLLLYAHARGHSCHMHYEDNLQQLPTLSLCRSIAKIERARTQSHRMEALVLVRYFAWSTQL